MSEAVSWPQPGSEQELHSDEPEVQQADIIPFPNRTGLLFNKATEQELVDYIGQAAKGLGINLDLGWSGNYGICYHFATSDDIDNFDNLTSFFEEEMAGDSWDGHNPALSALLCLEELPEDATISLHGYSGEAIPADARSFYLAPHWALCARMQDQAAPEELNLIDKLNKYDFADFLLRKHEEGWRPEF